MPKSLVRLVFGMAASVALFASSFAAHAQFLYDAKLDARAKSAVEQYEESKKDHLAFLDARLAEISRQESALVEAAVRANIAERDLAIAQVLGEDDRAEAAARLRGIVASRINAIVPATFALTCADSPCTYQNIQNISPTPQYAALKDQLDKMDRGRPDPLAFLPSRLATAKTLLDARFSKAKKKPTLGSAKPSSEWNVGWYCTDVYLLFLKGKANQTEAERDFTAKVLVGEAGLGDVDARTVATLSHNYCDAIAKAMDKPSIPPEFMDETAKIAMGTLLGSINLNVDTTAHSIVMPAVGLQLRTTDVAKETASLKAELADAEAAAKRLREERDKLKKELGAQDYKAQLQYVGCLVRELLDDSSEAPKPPKACSLDQEASEKTDAAKPDPAKPGAATAPLATLVEVRDVLSNLIDLGPELEKLRQEEAFEIIQYLADPATAQSLAKAGCQPGKPPTDDAAKLDQDALKRLCITTAAVQALDLLDQAGKIRKGIPGKVAELSVLLEQAELKATTVRQRAAALAERATNLESQRRGLLSELRGLIAAYEDVRTNNGVITPARLERGVIRLAGSVEAGRVSQESFVVRYGFVRQREFANRERAIAASRYAISDALLGTLQASASGGIKPEALAQFISALGLGTLGVAEVSK